MKKFIKWSGVIALLAVIGFSMLSCAGLAESAVYGTPGPGLGKIFYYSSAGFMVKGVKCHYLEVAPTDVSTSLTWASSANTKTRISGTGKGIGAGAANTDAILAADPNAPAARACKRYSYNGKSDWYLPSLDELKELYKNKKFIGNMLPTASYWSSSQSTDGVDHAYIMNLTEGKLYATNKGNKCSVRPIRAF